MKLNEMHKELMEIAKSLGISVRKEKGNFKSGFCIVNDKEVIVLNKNATTESLVSVLALCLSKYSDKLYIKPVVREFIDKETENRTKSSSDKIQIEINQES